MKKIGFIPLRKNSKGIPGKNRRKFLGRPLFSWVLTQAVFSKLDEVYIFTDDEWIIDFVKKEYSWTVKIKIMERSAGSATDTASTEAAMLEFLGKIDFQFDVFVLLQATSVFTRAQDIDASLRQVEDGYDSALTVVIDHRFYWSKAGEPINYDPTKRPRRQDFQGNLVENGAVYATTTEAFRNSKIRISGQIACVEMPEISFIEIDSLTDWQVAEKLMEDHLKENKDSLRRIDTLILDVDGVFTNGKVYYGSDGELAKSFDMRDGMGLEILREDKIEIIVITSEKSDLVVSRMKKLKIDKVHLGVKDKLGLLQHLIKNDALSFGQFAYVGDDVNDMACMCSVAWSFAPANAMNEIKSRADILLCKNSGNGAIREAANFISNYNKRFDAKI